MNSTKLAIESFQKLHTLLVEYVSESGSGTDFIEEKYTIRKILKGNLPINTVGEIVNIYCNTKTNNSWAIYLDKNGEKYYYKIQVDTKYKKPYLELYCIAIQYPNGKLYRGYIPESGKDYSFIR